MFVQAIGDHCRSNAGTYDPPATESMEDASGTDDLVFEPVDEAKGEPDEARRGVDALKQMCRDVAAPAATIGFLAESIASDPSASPKAHYWAEMIIGQSNLVSELCAFTLGFEQSSHAIRFDQIVSECTWAARSWFRGTIEETLDSVTLVVQRVPMLRLVTNLIAIACQSAGSGGTVRVVLGRDESYAHIEVDSTMARAEPSLTPTPEDSDVLAWRTVSDIVTDLHGRIRIEPGAIGGTSLQIAIPMKPTG